MKFTPFVFSVAVLGGAFNASADAPRSQFDDRADLDRMIAQQTAEALNGLKDLQGLESLKSLEALKRLEALQRLPELQQQAERSALLAMRQSRNDGRYRSLESDDRDAGAGGGSEGANPGTIVDEHRPLNPDGRVRISNTAGNINVTTWDRNEVAITGALGSGVEKLDINGDATSLNIIVRLPKHSVHTGDTTLKVRLPSNAVVDLDTVSADISIDGTRGPVKVNTVSGDVGLVVGSPEVTVQTVSGDLRLRAPAKLTKVNSVSGDLRMAGLQGKLSVETVSGNVELEGGKFSELRMKSISGDLHLDASFADSAQVVGETLSGEISFRVPASLTGTALLKSFSGDTRCDGAVLENVRSSRKREYVWGDGHGTRFELSSFSGDIRIERK